MNTEQFKPEPAVDISPAWPNAARAAAGMTEAPTPAVDAYQTADGITITECAVCITLEAQLGEELDDGRPYRAVTAVIGTPVCRDHLGHLGQAVADRLAGVSVVDAAAHLARGWRL